MKHLQLQLLIITTLTEIFYILVMLVYVPVNVLLSSHQSMILWNVSFLIYRIRNIVKNKKNMQKYISLITNVGNSQTVIYFFIIQNSFPFKQHNTAWNFRFFIPPTYDFLQLPNATLTNHIISILLYLIRCVVCLLYTSRCV